MLSCHTIFVRTSFAVSVASLLRAGVTKRRKKVTYGFSARLRQRNKNRKNLFSAAPRPFVSSSLCLFVSLSLRLFVSLSLRLFVSLSLCLFVSLSLCLFVPLSLCLFVSLSLCLFVSSSLRPFVSLSLRLFVPGSLQPTLLCAADAIIDISM